MRQDFPLSYAQSQNPGAATAPAAILDLSEFKYLLAMKDYKVKTFFSTHSTKWKPEMSNDKMSLLHIVGRNYDQLESNLNK